ncbi:UTP11-like, U3 small nucleolar ribonucleoprotein [Blyttiomyces sp. JEL0837]|nr:UTP11-like, U3 small nucleolar ribonucleoprotein [Blyttiomyces sp. JEL0837]
MREKAALKNPDEFYFGMIKNKTKEGVHIQQRNEKFDHEFLKLLKTQDQNYVNYQRSVNLKKLERLKNSFHFTDNNDSMNLDGTDAANNDDDDDEDDDDEEAAPKPKSKPTAKNVKHTVFVDTEKDANEFDPLQHFNTTEEGLRNPHKRTVKSAKTIELDERTQKKLQKKKESALQELKSRQEREETLRKMQLEMDLQKNLMGKGAKKKVGVDQKGLPVYKWKAVRKR